MESVFVTGGTGFIGRHLIETLLARGHPVFALVRPGSMLRLPEGVVPVVGNALDAASYAASVPPGATLVHLVGTPHPGPGKAAEFRRIDLESVRAATAAALSAEAKHFVYVSVAHPAPVMQAYISVRIEGEALVEGCGIPATILRPWYVLGPGHRWPYALLPVYAIARLLPSARESAERLGLVRLEEMVAALAAAIETPPASGVRIVDVPGIRRAAAMGMRR